MTIIPGYDDSGPELDGPHLAYDGSALLDLPGFWPAHLGGRLLAYNDEVSVLFGEDTDVTQRMYERLTDVSAWPVFSADTGRGARAAVIYRNFDEDQGVDYVLVPDGGTAITFGTDEGGPSGRGLTWNELSALAGRQPAGLERANTLLLFVPMLTRVEPADAEVLPVLAEALRTVGVPGDADVIAARLLHPDPEEEEDDDDFGDDPDHPEADRFLALFSDSPAEPA